MKLIISKDYDEMSKKAAEIVASEIRENPSIILGLATGGTPEGMYRELIKAHKEENLSFRDVVTFNLDEYIGIDGSHENSYRYYMDNMFFNHIDIKKKNTFVPDGMVKDPISYGQAYDQQIKGAGGIDLQVLGIGTNGHIAFNEPARELNVGTSVVDLTESTIKSNSIYFDSIEEVPTKALTMGLGSIMQAKKIVLLASGESKREAITKLLQSGKITTDLPASMLLLHRDVTVIVDQAAYDK